MIRYRVLAAVAAIVVAPVAAQAESSGGSRQAAGGAFMSTYVDHPHHDPHSLWSQANRTGQILGAPMHNENAGAPVARRGAVSPHWVAGTAPARRAR